MKLQDMFSLGDTWLDKGAHSIQALRHKRYHSQLMHPHREYSHDPSKSQNDKTCDICEPHKKGTFHTIFHMRLPADYIEHSFALRGSQRTFSPSESARMSDATVQLTQQGGQAESLLWHLWLSL